MDIHKAFYLSLSCGHSPCKTPSSTYIPHIQIRATDKYAYAHVQTHTQTAKYIEKYKGYHNARYALVMENAKGKKSTGVAHNISTMKIKCHCLLLPYVKCNSNLNLKGMTWTLRRTRLATTRNECVNLDENWIQSMCYFIRRLDTINVLFHKKIGYNQCAIS